MLKRVPSDCRITRYRASLIFRRFGAKPDKKIVDRSSGKSEFMEDTLHGNSDDMVVGIDRFWVVRAAGRAEWLSGGEKGFDGFVSENEQRGHRPQTGWQRFIASGVADAAKDLFAAEFLQIVSAMVQRRRQRRGGRGGREAPPRSPGCQTLLESRKCGG